MVATAVMGMMMLSFMGMIQFGAETFNLGKTKLDSVNYARIVFDLFKEELFAATNIYKAAPTGLWGTVPDDTLVEDTADKETTTPFYIRKITNTLGGSKRACFKIYLDSTTNCLIREVSGSLDGGTLVTNPSTSTEFSSKVWSKTRLARHVKAFKITRLTHQTMEVALEFGEDTDEDNVLDTTLSQHRMLLLAPPVGGVTGSRFGKG